MRASVDGLVSDAGSYANGVERYLTGKSDDAAGAALAAYRAAVHYEAATRAAGRWPSSIAERKRPLLYSRQQLSNDSAGLAVSQQVTGWFWPLVLHFRALAGWLAAQSGSDLPGLRDHAVREADVAAALEPAPEEFKGW